MEKQQTIIVDPKKPQFLMVLCILTFIGSGITLISAVWGYFAVKSLTTLIDPIVITREQNGKIQNTLVNAMEYALPSMIIIVVCSLLCLYGALKMWKLKKLGFYIYCVGAFTMPILGFVIGGSGFIGFNSPLIGIVLAVIWVTLYSLNFKYMR